MKAKQFIPVSRPEISSSDIEAVKLAVASSFIAGGDNIPKLETAVAGYCRRQYAVAVTNATSALFLAVKALDLPPRTKILIPAFTIISVLQAVVSNGHIPYFSEVDKETWNLTYEDVEKAIKKGIKAAIIPQTYASAPPMVEIAQLMYKHKLSLIEDAAEGFGGSQMGKLFGSFGLLSILSFYANKLISTGEGGMVLTDNKKLAVRLLSLRNLSFDHDRRFIHKEISGNYRLTNIQAALGLSQFKRINSFYSHRQRLYDLYLRLLEGWKKKMLNFQKIPQSIKSSYWVFPVLLAGFNRKKTQSLMDNLLSEGIETRHFFFSLNLQPAFKTRHFTPSTSLKLWQSGIYLPLGNGIKEKEVKTSAGVLIKFLKDFKQ